MVMIVMISETTSFYCADKWPEYQNTNTWFNSGVLLRFFMNVTGAKTLGKYLVECHSPPDAFAVSRR